MGGMSEVSIHTRQSPVLSKHDLHASGWGPGPSKISPQPHTQKWYVPLCAGVGCFPLTHVQQKREGKGKKKKEKAGAKAEFSICFCFPWCSFQGLGSAKPPKTMASSVHFPLCNLPLCPLLTAINHSVMC